MLYDDPGWKPPIRLLAILTILPLPQFWKRLERGSPLLVLMRTFLVSQAVRLALFGWVLSFLHFERTDSGWVVFLVVGSGVYSLAGVLWFGARFRSRLSLADDESALARAYSALYFIQTGLVIAPSLFGFVGAFIAGRFWVYFAGLPFTVVGLVLTAPTARDIRRRQEEINSGGRSLSLGRALMAPAT
jgi:hypothetical protein